jgi:hypothetical protein
VKFSKSFVHGVNNLCAFGDDLIMYLSLIAERRPCHTSCVSPMPGQIFYVRFRKFFVSHLSIPIMNVLKIGALTQGILQLIFYGATVATGPRPPNFEASRSHSDTPYSVRLI